MDNNFVNEQDKKDKKTEAGQKTAHVAGKAAGEYLAPGLGGKAYDALSKTKVGQALEQRAGKNLNRNPLISKATQGLNDSGALDAADKGLDLAGGADGLSNNDGLSNKNDSLSNIKGLSSFNNKTNGNQKNNLINNLSGAGNDNNEDTDSGYADKIFKFFSEHKAILISNLSGFFTILLIGIIAVVVVGSVGAAIVDFFTGIVDSVVGFFTKDQQELEEDFKDKLSEVRNDIQNDYNVCIDINLITAALTLNIDAEQFLEEGKEDVEDSVDDYVDEENIDSETGEPGGITYSKKMIKNIRLLANMQMITTSYELDSSGDYCSVTEEKNPIISGSKNSSTKELIASHDKGGFLALFTSKTYEEQNNAYYIYKPVYDVDGSCTYSYAKEKLKEIKANVKKEVSIGNLKTREDSVFYWNLINSFVPSYYSEFIPDEEPKKSETIKRIADDIYLLYNDFGPSQSCSVYGSNYDCSDLDVNNTTLTKEEFVTGVNNYKNDNGLWYLIQDNAEQIYDVSIYNGLNPEIVVTRAILEGFAPGNRCGFTNYNVWGWGASNGQECEKAKVWKSWDEALLGFVTGFKNSFPTTEVFLTSYAYLGDYWYNPGNSGLGGCYYAPYIFPNGIPEHVKNACDISKKDQCTLDNTSSCIKTTKDDKLLYGQYQAKNINDLRKKIWNITSGSCGSYGIQEGSCIVFKQSDKRWENEKLINGTTTLGNAGCAVTSVSIAMTCSGTLKNPNAFNPSVLNKELRPNQSSDLGALILWGNKGISDLTNGFHYVDSIANFSGTLDSKVNKLKELMQQRRALIIHTSSRAISPRAGSHYVVLSAIDGSDVRILDPATGQTGKWSVNDIDQIIIYEW